MAEWDFTYGHEGDPFASTTAVNVVVSGLPDPKLWDKYVRDFAEFDFGCDMNTFMYSIEYRIYAISPLAWYEIYQDPEKYQLSQFDTANWGVPEPKMQNLYLVSPKFNASDYVWNDVVLPAEGEWIFVCGVDWRVSSSTGNVAGYGWVGQSFSTMSDYNTISYLMNNNGEDPDTASLNLGQFTTEARTWT